MSIYTDRNTTARRTAPRRPPQQGPQPQQRGTVDPRRPSIGDQQIAVNSANIRNRNAQQERATTQNFGQSLWNDLSSIPGRLFGQPAAPPPMQPTPPASSPATSLRSAGGAAMINPYVGGMPLAAALPYAMMNQPGPAGPPAPRFGAGSAVAPPLQPMSYPEGPPAPRMGGGVPPLPPTAPPPARGAGGMTYLPTILTPGPGAPGSPVGRGEYNPQFNRPGEVDAMGLDWPGFGFGSQQEGEAFAKDFNARTGSWPWMGPGTPSENLGNNLRSHFGGGSAGAGGGIGAGIGGDMGLPAAPPAQMPQMPQNFGPFPSFDAWANAFAAEHGGRRPNDVDVQDAMDSFDFANSTGRSPTQRDWLRRYYTGGFFGEGDFRPTRGYNSLPPAQAPGSSSFAAMPGAVSPPGYAGAPMSAPGGIVPTSTPNFGAFGPQQGGGSLGLDWLRLLQPRGI